MSDNLLSDSVAQALKKTLKSDEAVGRWVRSVKGMVTSKSFTALLLATGGFEEAVTWLTATAPSIPRESKRIERFHVRVRDTQGDGLRQTTVSLDHELYRALIEKTGSGQAASTWISTTTKSLDPGAGSLSRALQAAIVRYVSESPGRGA